MKDDTKKLLTNDSEDCTDCDDCVAGCGGDCDSNLPMTPLSCCLPNSYALKVTIGSNASGCQPQGADNFIWETTGGGITGVCCLQLIGDPGNHPGYFLYGGSIKLTVGIDSWRSTTSCSDKSGPVTHSKIENPGVRLSLYPPSTAYNPTSKWLATLYVRPLEGRCGGTIIFWGVKYFDFNAWNAAHPGVPTPLDSLYFETTCDGATLTNPSELAFYGDGTNSIPYWSGGTATIKPCCEATPQYTCAGGIDVGAQWVSAVECISGNVRDDIWLNTDDPRYDPALAYAVATSAGSTLCVSFTGPTQDTAPAQIAHILAVYSSCSDPICAGAQYIQALDCDGNTLVNFWANVGDALTDGTAYVLPGTCVYFDSADAADDLPDGAFLADLGDYSTAVDCDSCVGSGGGGTGDCDTDNTGADDVTINFVAHGCDIHDDEDIGAPTTPFPTTLTLTAQGDGTWRYSDADFTAVITCSGKYWVLSLSPTAGGTHEIIWHVLRTGTSPNDGPSTWDFISFDANGCTEHPEAITV